MYTNNFSNYPARAARLLGIVALSALLAAPASAANSRDYYLVIPVKKTSLPEQSLSVTLNAYAMPSLRRTTAITTIFDFSSVLQVSGDPNFDGSGVTWTVAAGSLPRGTTVNNSGVFSGRVNDYAGPYNFTLQASYKDKSALQSYQVHVIVPTVELGGSPPADASVGEFYSYDLKPYLTVTNDPEYAGDGITGVTWVGMQMPPWLSLTPDGVLQGTPTSPGVWTFTYQAVYGGKTPSKSATVRVQ